MTQAAQHIDLFTGIGGFTVAAQQNGLETVVMCESDEFRRAGLSKAWPGIPIIEDVREFDGTKRTNAFILTGGVPCQPASRAGKQRGAGDDRWLWPETLRIIAEAKPRWCLFENPPGIKDVGLDGILSELEAIGYEVGVLDIPACAVNSPQLRHRYWIVAFSQQHRPEGEVRPELPSASGGEHQPACGSDREDHMAHAKGSQDNSRRNGSVAETEGCREGGNSTAGVGCQGDVADTGSGNSKQRGVCPDGEETGTGAWSIDTGLSMWGSSLWTPCADGKVRRTPDDTFGLVNGLPRKLLGALGDSIVWPVAYQIIRAIVSTEENRR